MLSTFTITKKKEQMLTHLKERRSPMEHESQTIGSLASKIANLPDRSNSTPAQSRQLSATTGAQSLVRLGENSIGQPLGATGAVARLSEAVQTALAGTDAWRTDKALLASFPQPVARRIDSIARLEPTFEVVGYTVKDGAAPEDLRQSIAIIEAACQPSPGRLVVQELTKVMSVTKAREHDEIDQELSLVTMAESLSEFPMDVVKDACQAWMEFERWRPSLAEIREYCTSRFRARASLRSALQRSLAASPPPPKPAGKDWVELTDDEKAEHHRMMAEVKRHFAEGAGR